MITKVSEVKNIVEKGIKNPQDVFPEIKKMAESNDWQIREVATSVLVEIGKKKRVEVIKEMEEWARSLDANIRRTSIESLRYVCRLDPEAVLPILERLKSDNALYVEKAVAHILREISKKNPDFVYNLCQQWTSLKNKNTFWIIKDGIKKLSIDEQKELKSLLND